MKLISLALLLSLSGTSCSDVNNSVSVINVDDLVNAEVDSSSHVNQQLKPTIQKDTSFVSEPSKHILCKTCGRVLFSRANHLHNLTLPPSERVLGYKRSNVLGDGGIIHEFQRSHKSAITGFTMDMALFSATNAKLTYGAVSDQIVIPEYSQQPVSCGFCNALVGWRFELSVNAPSSTTSHSSHSPHSHATPPTPSSSVQVKPYSHQHEVTDLSSLSNRCIELSAGYWTYEFCYQHRVSQYHPDVSTGTRNPNWSLGEYNPNQGPIESTSLNPTDSLFYYTSNYYKNGQQCDELGGKGRATEIQYFCCPDYSLPVLNSVTEVSICRYVMRICVPSLCKVDKGEDESSSVEPEVEIGSEDDDVVSNSSLPSAFFGVMWQAVIGDKQEPVKSLQGDFYVTGITSVRFQ